MTDLAQPVAEWTGAMRADLHRVRDIIDYRIAVETRAAELAAVRRTDDQMESMAETAGQPDRRHRGGRARARRCHGGGETPGHRRSVPRAHRGSGRQPQDRRGRPTGPRRTLRHGDPLHLQRLAAGLPHDHRRVLDAIARGDPVAARAAMEEHIRHGADVWLKNGRTAQETARRNAPYGRQPIRRHPVTVTRRPAALPPRTAPRAHRTGCAWRPGVAPRSSRLDG